MPLPQIEEPVAAPRPLSDSAAMAAFAARLAALGYTQANCAARVGSFPRLGVNFWDRMRPGWTAAPADPIDTLLSLLIDGRTVDLDRIHALAGTEFIDTGCGMGLFESAAGQLQSRLCLFPCQGLYIATDRAARNRAINQVMWLWGESYLLAGLPQRRPRRRAIDLGTGSGVHALVASRHCQSVVGGDINPRALEFARFNAALNGIRNAEFVLSDLLDSIEGPCDLLLANPPYLPNLGSKAGENFWSGGLEGTELLARIVGALPERLEAGGEAHIVALYPNAPGTTTHESLDRWLHGQINSYQVLDFTWPVPRYQDALSDQPFEGDKSAWRFGVLSLRRAPGGAGWWREQGGNGLFFDTQGQCTVQANFEA